VDDRRRMIRTDLKTIAFVVLYIMSIVAAAMLVVAVPTIGFFVFLAVVVVGLYLVLSWHTGKYAYICKACGETFAITLLQNLLAPHTFTTQYLRCPKCGQRTWATGVIREK
jgi:DNA-directed RNA polymerase subunit RPC12/RpoP